MFDPKTAHQVSSETVIKRYLLPFSAVCLLLGIAVAKADYASVILGDNPVAYYRLDESVGATVAIDSSPSGNNGAYVYNTADNYPLLGQPGIVTNSASFDGQGGYNIGLDYVSIPYQPYLATVPFSAECWAQANGQAADYSVVMAMFGSYNDAGGVTGWNFYQSPGPNSYWLLNMKPSPTLVFNSNATVTPGQWSHLAATFDGTTATFYVNGVAVAAVNGTGFIPDNGSSYFGEIGAGIRTGWLPFNGQVGEVAFYNSTLSPAQVLAHYQAGAGTNSVSKVTLTIGPDGFGNVVVTWPGGAGTLQSSTSAAGPYTPISGAISPYTNAPGGISMFYRIHP